MSISPRTVWKSQPQVRRAYATRVGYGPILRSEILRNIHNSKKPWTRTGVPRVDTPRVVTPRKVWKTQPGVRRASATRGGYGPIPGSAILPNIYSNKPWTKTGVPRVDTAPQGVENPTQGSQSQRQPGRIRSYPWIRNSSKHLHSNKPWTKTGVPRVDTAPQGVKTQPRVRRASATRG